MKRGAPEIMRSKLFVPASSPALFPKALASEADAICFDLEDGVLPERKAEARHTLREYFSSGFHTEKMIMVRVNHVRSAFFAEDLSAVVSPAVSLLVLPKVEDTSEIKDAASALSVLEMERKVERPIAIAATIESPRGMRLAREIAESEDRVVALQIGLADFFGPLGIEQSDTFAAHQVRLRLRLSASEAGVPCFDSAYPDIEDETGLVREANMARSLGFAGKSCIHPRQVAFANRIFSPQPEEIAWSLRILEAGREAAMAGAGAFKLDGRMIDKPFILRAEAILELAKKLHLLDTVRKEN
jgi:citrate lyase subunit beta/citryl-CoA lyase